MIDREQDKRVAEILGWKNIKYALGFHSSLGGDHPLGNFRTDVPRFTTDAGADYQVLEWARTQRNEFQFAFRHEISCLFEGYPPSHSRPILGPIAYIAGDYSRALLALDEKGLLPK